MKFLGTDTTTEYVFTDQLAEYNDRKSTDYWGVAAHVDDLTQILTWYKNYYDQTT